MPFFLLIYLFISDLSVRTDTVPIHRPEAATWHTSVKEEEQKGFYYRLETEKLELRWSVWRLHLSLITNHYKSLMTNSRSYTQTQTAGQTKPVSVKETSSFLWSRVTGVSEPTPLWAEEDLQSFPQLLQHDLLVTAHPDNW